MNCGCNNCFNFSGLSNGADGVYKKDGLVWFNTVGVRATGALETELNAFTDAQLQTAQVDCSTYNLDQSTYHVETFAEIDSNGTPTGIKVLAATTRAGDGTMTTSYTNLKTGAAWTGDSETELEAIADTDHEADPRKMCDDGTTSFLRWFILEDGVPTGNYTDTDMGGTAYTPVGAVVEGVCSSDTVRTEWMERCVRIGEFGNPIKAFDVVEFNETLGTRTVIRVEDESANVLTMGTGVGEYGYVGDCC